ncbi:hypothetical protein CR513_60910, partial [Mucuna pruriens]
MLFFFPSSSLMLSLPSQVFGCVVFARSHNPYRRKLDPRVVKCVFIGYPSNKKEFKCYYPPSHWVFVSMDITFHETQSFFKSSLSSSQLPFPTQDVQVQEVTLKNLSLKRPTMKRERKIDIMESNTKGTRNQL